MGGLRFDSAHWKRGSPRQTWIGIKASRERRKRAGSSVIRVGGLGVYNGGFSGFGAGLGIRLDEGWGQRASDSAGCRTDIRSPGIEQITIRKGQDYRIVVSDLGSQGQGFTRFLSRGSTTRSTTGTKVHQEDTSSRGRPFVCGPMMPITAVMTPSKSPTRITEDPESFATVSERVGAHHGLVEMPVRQAGRRQAFDG